MAGELSITAVAAVTTIPTGVVAAYPAGPAEAAGPAIAEDTRASTGSTATTHTAGKLHHGEAAAWADVGSSTAGSPWPTGAGVAE
ncbi:hypothetical protein MM1218R_05349 [Mycobacterium marinum]|nr:hypothetical protein MM1218R_05349 [Mycobacterium marinum]AXN52682.1 hypothetical protein CCUG20998_05309 [Mycobacterium marinum]RFZ12013.1 hypothetical protein DE4381_00966 [Mycobacterium marinum]RFZ23618.1 hypothetical protein DSM43519_02452 [Mycobacterium marinum]RFZ29533.1 hypothetical protein DSM44344_00871 [Mycobacterium marinum]